MNNHDAIYADLSHQISQLNLRDSNLQTRAQVDPDVFALETEYHAVEIAFDREGHAVQITALVGMMPEGPSPGLLRALLAMNAEMAEMVQLIPADDPTQPDNVELVQTFPVSRLAGADLYDILTGLFQSVGALHDVISDWTETSEPVGDDMIMV